MFHYSQFRFITLLICLGLMPGCYKKFEQFSYASADFEIKKDAILVRANKFDDKESKQRFGKSLLEYGYQPIELTIYNDSDDVYLLRASSIDLPLSSSYTVAQAAHIPVLTYTCVPAYIAGLFFWPALIPVAGAGLWMAASNQTLTNQVTANAFEGDAALEILPFERISRMIFTSVGCADHGFSLHLFNIHKKTFVPFTINFQN